MTEWYNRYPTTLHIRQLSYHQNPLAPYLFVPPWWWNHPLFIENNRAHVLSTNWYGYKDHPFLQHYLKPAAKVPRIDPHPTIEDLWNTPKGQLESDTELWRELGWVARTESSTTRARKLGFK